RKTKTPTPHRARPERRGLLQVELRRQGVDAGSEGSSMSERIDRYEIVESMSRGAAGTVYKAMDASLKRLVALKLFAGDLASQLLARKLCEARLWSALGHPNLVSIHDVGESTEGSFVVMELPEGPTLEQLRGEAVAIPLGRRIF